MSQSITPELRQWILAQVAARHSPEAVLQAMTKAGWQDEVALTALETTLSQHLASHGAAQAQAEAQAQLQAQMQALAQATRAASQTQASTGSSHAAVPDPDLSGGVNLLDLGDRRVSVLLSLASPRVVVLGGFLSGDECDGLIAAARPRMARSLTVETQTGGEAVNEARTSHGMFFQRGESELITRIEARIARLVRWPVENGEGVQVLNYQPGAEYRPHYDYFDPAQPGTATILKRGGQRVGTLVMYLNNPERGGGTTFPDVGLEVAPQRGNAVFFGYDRPHPDTRTLHGGAPVQAGEKWVATKWLREREFV